MGMATSIFDQWLEKEKTIWEAKKRAYTHFDVNLPISHWEKYVQSPTKIASHEFLPFIHLILETARVRANAEGIRKLDPKKRPIYCASHKDAFIFSWYAFQLQHLYEAWLKDKDCAASILAYRKLNSRNNIHFANEAFDCIKRRNQPTVALAFDVTSFFDNLGHEGLLKNWKKLRGAERLSDDDFAVYKATTQFAYVDRNKLIELLKLKEDAHPSRFCDMKTFREVVRGGGLINKHTMGKGVPQGAPISAVLSNVYMMEFDVKMYAFMKELGGHYFRYSDDILLICDQTDQEKAAQKVMDEISNPAINLEINDAKTDITYFARNSEGVLFGYGNAHPKKMQYLGLEFDGQNIFLRSSSISRYHRKVRNGVRRALMQSLGKNSKGEKVFKRKLYRSYSHHGSQNFIAYALRASKIASSKKIRLQVKGNIELINSLIENLRPKVEFRMEKRRAFDISQSEKKKPKNP